MIPPSTHLRLRLAWVCSGLNSKQEREATAKPASFLSVAVIIHPKQKQLREERVYLAYTSRSPIHH